LTLPFDYYVLSHSAIHGSLENSAIITLYAWTLHGYVLR